MTVAKTSKLPEGIQAFAPNQRSVPPPEGHIDEIQRNSLRPGTAKKLSITTLRRPGGSSVITARSCRCARIPDTSE
jgi:hypothetical protein